MVVSLVAACLRSFGISDVHRPSLSTGLDTKRRALRDERAQIPKLGLCDLGFGIWADRTAQAARFDPTPRTARPRPRTKSRTSALLVMLNLIQHPRAPRALSGFRMSTGPASLRALIRNAGPCETKEPKSRNWDRATWGSGFGLIGRHRRHASTPLLVRPGRNHTRNPEPAHSLSC